MHSHGGLLGFLVILKKMSAASFKGALNIFIKMISKS